MCKALESVAGMPIRVYVCCVRVYVFMCIPIYLCMGKSVHVCDNTGSEGYTHSSNTHTYTYNITPTHQHTYTTITYLASCS